MTIEKPNPVGVALWCVLFCIVFFWAPLVYWWMK